MSNRRPSALRRVLEPVFGRRWRVVLSLIPVVVGWPVLVFRDLVAFDAADFVEEWIKLSVTTFIFFFLVEVVQERRRAETTRREFDTFFDEHVLARLHEGLRRIEEAVLDVQPGAVRDMSDHLLAATRDLEHASSAIDSAATLRPDLTYAVDAFGVASGRVRDSVAKIAELAANRVWGEPAIEDLSAATRALRTALSELTAMKEAE